MRHLIGQILAVAVAALPGVAWADAPKPEPVEITHEGAKLKGFLYRPEGNGPFPAVVALHDCDGLAGRRMPLARRYRDWGERLVAAGYGEYQPLSAIDSARNRRIELKLTSR